MSGEFRVASLRSTELPTFSDLSCAPMTFPKFRYSLCSLWIAVCMPLWSWAQSPVDQSSQPISAFVRRIFEDRAGNLWLGTNGDGVLRYDGSKLHRYSVAEGLSGVAVRGIVQDRDGAVWIGTEGGISRYLDEVWTSFALGDTSAANDVWSFYYDKAGGFWIGTANGVVRFDGKNATPFSIPRATVDNPASRFSPKVVWSMCEDHAGNLWFGTDGEGARKYDGTSFTTYTTADGLVGNQVSSVLCDAQGRVWLGAITGGVSCYDGQRFQNYGVEEGLSDGWVWTLLEDRAGHLWISTLGNQVCRYDGKSFTAFGPEQGLNHTHVQSICEARDGTLWLGCSGGLYRLRDEAFVFVTRDGPWSAAHPLLALAHLPSATWHLTAESGQSQFDSWTWGPGQHSLRSTTTGADAAGEPTTSVLDLIYWHPARQCIRQLGINRKNRRTEGTLQIKGKRAEISFDFFSHFLEPEKHRPFAARYAFDQPNQYRLSLFENSIASNELLVALDYFHTTAEVVAHGQEKELIAEYSEPLQALAPFIGPTWQAIDASITSTTTSLRAEYQWIPGAGAIYARELRLGAEDAATPLLDAYFYYHPRDQRIHYLGLTATGSVDEGLLLVLEDGTLEVALTHCTDQGTEKRAMQFHFESDGTLFKRTWLIHDDQRTLLSTVHYHKRSD